MDELATRVDEFGNRWAIDRRGMHSSEQQIKKPAADAKASPDRLRRLAR